MKRLATAGFLTCIVFLTGCAKITGQWTLDCIDPESERQNFDLKCLVLNEDNTFLVRASAEAKTAQMTGTYCYDKNTKALTFTPENAPARTYTAAVEWNGKMKVCPTGPKAWTAYLKHCKCETCSGKSGTCTCACSKCGAKCRGNCGCKACTCPGKCGGPAPAEKRPGQCPMHSGEPVKAGPGTGKN